MLKPLTKTLVIALRISPVVRQVDVVQALRVSENLCSTVARKEMFTVAVPPEASGTDVGVTVVARPVAGEAIAWKNTVPLRPFRLVSVAVITVGEVPVGMLTGVGVAGREWSVA